MRSLARLVLALSLACVSLGAVAEDKPSLSNKWRIEVSEGANNDGSLLFRLTPDQGTAVDVPVTIKKGRSENNIAKDIRDALKKTLDAKSFHSEVDDGEDVLVKKRKGPDFALVLVESTLEGTRINVEKE